MQQMENVVIQFAAEWSDVYICVCVCDWMRVMAAMNAPGAGTKAWQWAATWNEWHVVSVSGSMAMATPESQHGQHVYGGACSTLMHVYFQLPAVDCSIIHTYMNIHIPRYTFEVTHVIHIDCILQIYIYSSCIYNMEGGKKQSLFCGTFLLNAHNKQKGFS